MWRCLAVVFVEADWFETFRVDIETEFSSECWESIGVAWSSVSFLEGACFLSGIDNLRGVIAYSCIVAKVSGRGILQVLIVTSG